MSKLIVSRRFGPENSDVECHGQFATVEYVLTNKGSTLIEFFWLMDQDLSFASNAWILHSYVTDCDFPNLCVAMPEFLLISSIPYLVLPPDSSLTIGVEFQRDEKKATLSQFVQGVNYQIRVSPETVVEGVAINRLELH